jgi:hypothetical protein
LSAAPPDQHGARQNSHKSHNHEGEPQHTGSRREQS